MVGFGEEKMDFEMKTIELFTKAGEIAHKFGADVAVLIVSSDGKNNYTFESSNWTRILAKCVSPEHPPAIHLFRPEGDEKQPPLEIDVLRVHQRVLEQIYVEAVDIGISEMNLYELIELEKQLRERTMCIEERKDQLFIDQYEHLRMLIKELQGELASTTTEHIVGPGTEFLPSTITCAAPIATDNIQSDRNPSNTLQL